MENPFRFGTIATGEYFTDRTAELAELAADIRSGQNVFVISPRRYGKTSLVQRVAEQVRQDGVLVAYVDLFLAPTRERLADQLAGAIYDGLIAPFDRLRRRVAETFQRLVVRPSVSLNPDGTPSFEFQPGLRSPDIDRTLEQLLELPGEIAQQRHKRVALILDEFQEVVAIDAGLTRLMRAVFQRQSEVAHVFLGSRRHLLERVFTAEDEPLYGLAKRLPLRPIPTREFADFLRQRFAASEVAIDESAVARILAITGGHPQDTQQLSYFSWSLAHETGTPATATLVERALERLLQAEHDRYTLLWEHLAAHQRFVLTALVAEQGPVYGDAYRRRHRLGAATNVQKSLTRLAQRELVEQTPDGTYFVPEVFLRAWIARTNRLRQAASVP